MSADAIRQPAIAGTFYSGSADALAASLDDHLKKARVQHAPSKAIIAPHAGHVYSGPIAGTIYASLRPVANRIRRVVLIGPSHRVFVPGLAVCSHQHWRTPLGEVPIDRAAVDALAALPGVEVMDDAHAPEHCLEVQLPFLQRLLRDFSIVPILTGPSEPARVEAILQRLWGGPETLIVISSDLSHYHDYEAAQKLDRAASGAIERLVPKELDDEQACGRIAIKGLLRRARALDMRVTTLDLRNSGDTAGSRDRVVGYGAYGFEYARSARLGDAQRRVLIDMCREVIAKSAARGGREPNFRMGSLPPQLMASRAAFVTLKMDGDLRGCIGSITPSCALALDVAKNSYRAAFSDPRFSKVTTDDVDRLDIGVSILSTPRPLHCRSEAELVEKLSPDQDGVILSEGDKRGLFLPQVWENVPDPRAFVKHLKNKAGIEPDHWSEDVKVYRFSTETFGALPRSDHAA